ncbi:MAG: sugar phosphate isomerase/epimerase [Mariprofundaceae bacterium]
MKLAISNIAWDQHDEAMILDVLKSNGVSGIEIAPTKLWHDWKGASYKAAKEYKEVMLKQGFELPAMQALLFGKQELQLFDKTSHPAFLEHIKLLAGLANGFGSKVLVFGSPKNRRRGQLPYSEAMKIAENFFHKAGEICAEHECCIGLEHNPVEYGCDFITNVLDAKGLVENVGHKGFKLHVDSAGLHMCGGDISKMIRKAGEFVHYHISEPMLEPIFGGVVHQEEGLNTLKSLNYDQWISIEMKQPASIEFIKRSVGNIKNIIAHQS